MVKKKQRKRIPKGKVKEEQKKELEKQYQVRTSRKELDILGLVSDELQSCSSCTKLNPYVALKYFRSDWQCFSDWSSAQLKEFSSFLAHLGGHTWQQVYETASRKPKHGLAYTTYNVSDVKNARIRKKLEEVSSLISEDINFFELRVNQNTLRVHGFQSQSIFFLVALDKDHEAFPE